MPDGGRAWLTKREALGRGGVLLRTESRLGSLDAHLDSFLAAVPACELHHSARRPKQIFPLSQTLLLIPLTLEREASPRTECCAEIPVSSKLKDSIRKCLSVA